jgi:hypothetical protein
MTAYHAIDRMTPDHPKDISPTLAACLAEFATRPDAMACADPKVAFGGCLAMAMRFAAVVRGAGLAAEVVVLAYVADDGELVGRHYVTLVETVSVDWTARQFDRDCSKRTPIPLVVPRRRLLRPIDGIDFDVADAIVTVTESIEIDDVSSDIPDWLPKDVGR